MQRRHRSTIFFLLCASATAVGVWSGVHVSFAKQTELLRELREVSTIVFGIMGAWAALIYPNQLKQRMSLMVALDVDREQARRFGDVTRCLTFSAGIVITVLAMQFLGPIVQNTSSAKDHALLFRRASFGIACLLAVIELWTVLVVLVALHSADADGRWATEAQDVIEQGTQGRLGVRKPRRPLKL